MKTKVKFLGKTKGDTTGPWQSPNLVIKQIKEYSNPSWECPDFFFKDDPPSKRPTPLLRAIQHTFKQLTSNTPAKMIHLNDVFKDDSLDIWNNSPGIPWRDKGYKTLDDIRNDPKAIRGIRSFWCKAKRDVNTTAFHDCQGSGQTLGDNKIKTIWGYPATVTFGEAVFAPSLINAYKKMKDSPIVFDYETAIGEMKRFEKYNEHCTIDFLDFEKTVPAWLINVAFDT